MRDTAAAQYDSGYGSETSEASSDLSPAPPPKKRARKQAAPKKIPRSQPTGASQPTGPKTTTPRPSTPPTPSTPPPPALVIPKKKRAALAAPVPTSSAPVRPRRRIKPTPVAQGPRQGLLHKLLHAYFSAFDHPPSSPRAWTRKLVKKAHGAAEKYLAEKEPASLPSEEEEGG